MSQVTTVRPAPGTTPRNGLPERRDYAYRGTGVDTLTAHLDTDDEPTWPCGTPLGYHRGCRCADCRCAEMARKRSYRRPS